MRIAIYTKGGKYLTDNEMKHWGELMKRYNLSCSINYDGDEEFASLAKSFGFELYDKPCQIAYDTKFIISYGGDGTLLHSIEKFREYDIPILGVNSGRLGFLASVPREDAEAALQSLIRGDYTLEQRSLMAVESAGLTTYVFNEFTLQKSSFSMINVKLLINGEYVANYMSDGLIVSSPSGSTAYSMSVGGAIIAPDCNCYIINPIAPHNLNMRPIIISDTSVLELSAESRDDIVLATMDNRWQNVPCGQKFIVRKSSYNVRFIKLKNISFYRTIREKLMWGIDSRQIFTEK